MKHKTTSNQDEKFFDVLFDGIWAPDLMEAIKDLITGDTRWVLEWVAENFAPDEVYDVAALEKWASDVWNTEEPA